MAAIAQRDAIIDLTDEKRPREAAWPEADVIVGNPPFLGGKLLRTHLGDAYVDAMFAVYEGRVARESDLCCYWFEKARAQIEGKMTKRAGLLATQAIRGGANRRTLERIKASGDIFYAQADRKWIQDGVAVRVSMVGFDDGSEAHRRLNVQAEDNVDGALTRASPVEGINANLTSQVDVTRARRLRENLGISFMGDTKVGSFDVDEGLGRQMLERPNPHGKPNSDVVRPWMNGEDVSGRSKRKWIVDFPPGMSEADAALYEVPFEHIKKHVRPARLKNARKLYAERWWIHGEPRPEMRERLRHLPRFAVTPNLTKFRLFSWLEARVLADHQLIAFARSDDYFFGVLHSRAHEVWALAQGTQLESRPRYTPTTCFETFPFPRPTPDQEEVIASAAAELDALRRAWLDPAPAGGLEIAESELKRRTLTNLYNERPTWLSNAHRALDEAVFAAYGWPEPPEALTDAEIVARLLRLNLEREPAG